ncbi:hypothetical protein [Pseudomonas subflava]|uniref:hypothetical protein n=1 Tax=Pseudomonas subflava TaxID=2952933 RepID=UPI002079C7F8|nr:hypothetical protein [Pseudomonas subflava]
MSQHDQDLQQEQQLLGHFREHNRGEPSAAVDALILAAARQAAEAPRPSLSQRLHAWLFGADSRSRWPMAVAGLAVFGIGLNLALQTGDQPSEPPALARAPAPALQEMAPAGEQAMSPQYKKAERSLAGSVESQAAFSASPPAAAAPRQVPMAKPQSAPMEALADSAAAPSEREEARTPAADMNKAAEARALVQQHAQAAAGKAAMLAEDVPSLPERLRAVLQLRAEGKQGEADQLLAALKGEYPQHDLEAELKRLQSEMNGAR